MNVFFFLGRLPLHSRNKDTSHENVYLSEITVISCSWFIYPTWNIGTGTGANCEHSPGPEGTKYRILLHQPSNNRTTPEMTYPILQNYTASSTLFFTFSSEFLYDRHPEGSRSAGYHGHSTRSHLRLFLLFGQRRHDPHNVIIFFSWCAWPFIR